MSFVLLSLTFRPKLSPAARAAFRRTIVNLSVIPDLIRQGEPGPRISGHALTVGRLAGLVRELAARPADWWHLVRFDGAPVSLAVECELWLSAWPPGRRTDPRAGLLAVLAGELTERTISERGVAERTLRANRVQVYGGGFARELVNDGPGFAITLHTAAADR
jgi:hypothetical protein